MSPILFFLSQLVNPDATFNKPGSDYSFDFQKAYSLLQLFKANSNPPVGEMHQAYSNKVFVSGNEWKAYFSNGIEVHFYLDANGKIISFFPKY